MTDRSTRRRLLGAVAAVAGGLAGCLGGRRSPASDPEAGGGTTAATTDPGAGTTTDPGTTDQGTTEPGSTDPGTVRPSRRDGRPAVVDLGLSTALDSVLGPDQDPISAYDTVAAEFGRVVVDGESYGVRFDSPDPDTAVCQAVPSRNVAVVARPADPPDGADLRALSDLPERTRPAVERAIAAGSYRTSRLTNGIDTVEGTDGTNEGATDPPVPGDLPPLSWVRGDRPYLVGAFRWQSPACTVAVHEYTLVPAVGGSTAGPTVGAVDATGAESREAVAGAASGEYAGSGDPPAAVEAVAGFDYAARVDSGTVTYHRPSLSVREDGYAFRLDPVLSGAVGP